MGLRGSVQHHGFGVGVSSVLEGNLVVGRCYLFYSRLLKSRNLAYKLQQVSVTDDCRRTHDTEDGASHER